MVGVRRALQVHAAMLMLLQAGCQGVFRDRSAALVPPSFDGALAGLRVYVDESVGIVPEGDIDPALPPRLRGALESYLARQGLVLVKDAPQPADFSVRIDTRLRGVLLLTEGEGTLTIQQYGVAVDVVKIDFMVRPSERFPDAFASALAAGFMRSPRVIAAAGGGHARPEPPAPVPSPASPAKVAVKNAPPPPKAAPPARAVVPSKRAPPSGPTKEAIAVAQIHADSATAFYNVSRFSEALDEYEQAYLAAADPVMLFNMGQCQRKLGHRAEAVELYKAYLRSAPNAPNKADLEGRIRELEK